jgi:hypothetical protein
LEEKEEDSLYLHVELSCFRQELKDENLVGEKFSGNILTPAGMKVFNVQWSQSSPRFGLNIDTSTYFHFKLMATQVESEMREGKFVFNIYRDRKKIDEWEALSFVSVGSLSEEHWAQTKDNPGLSSTTQKKMENVVQSALVLQPEEEEADTEMEV